MAKVLSIQACHSEFMGLKMYVSFQKCSQMAKTMHDNYVAIMLMIITKIAIALYTQICFIITDIV